MDLQPYGPLEQAMAGSALPVSPSQNSRNGLFWGICVGLVIGAIAGYFIAEKKLEKNEGKTN